MSSDIDTPSGRWSHWGRCPAEFPVLFFGYFQEPSEQNLPLGLPAADRHYVIDRGRSRFEGTSLDLQENEKVKRTYLSVAK
jgi:hypothetical protein